MKINTKSVFKTALSLAAVMLFGTQASAQCNPPIGPVTISNIETTSVTATWNASISDPSGAKYEWEVRLDDGSLPGSGTPAQTGFSDNGVTSTIAAALEFSTTYKFYVRYICVESPINASTWISSTSFTTETLQTPVATPATAVTDSSLRANWNALPGADSYQFDLSTDNFMTFVSIYENFSTTETFLDISGLTPNTVYYYRVRGVGNNGTITVTTGNSNTIARATLGPATSVYTWEGPGEGHWEPATGAVDDTKDVIINWDYDTNNPNTESFEAKNLIITEGFNVTIADGDYIKLRAQLNNLNTGNEGLTIQSGGNLTQLFTGGNNNSGGMKVERLSSPLFRLDYTMWSSPTSGKPGTTADQTLLDFSPLTLANRFYIYNTATNVFNTVPPSTTVFQPGNGYLIRMANNHPEYVVGQSGTKWLGTFEGPINGGTYNVPLDLSGSRFNMIGNPYPSLISLDKFIQDNMNTTGTIYFWRRRNNTAGTGNTQAFYATYTLAGGVGTPVTTSTPTSGIPEPYAQVGQGFLVQATTGSTGSQNATFTNAMRSYDVGNVPFFRTADKNRFWLNVSYNQEVYNEMLVAYMPSASNDLDRADGKFFGDATIALTSYLNNEEYVIQGRAPFTVTDVVPLHFRASATGNFTIAFDRADGIFNTTQTIYLKDNLTNITHDIKAAPYTFATGAGTFANRFEIVYSSPLTVGDVVLDANAIAVVKQNGMIVINSGSVTMSNVKIFDIRGRLIAQKNNVNASETSITAGAENQVLIVQIVSDNGATISKKFVN